MPSPLQAQIATQTLPPLKPTTRNTYITLLKNSSQQKTGPLQNLPISLKDCFDLTGTVTTAGSLFYAQHNPIAEKNSWIAQRLLNLGAIITGKTHLHQLAYGITGENRDYGDCLQPLHPELLTGGSSSGAAASLQEGSALVAIGTDTGGSVRIPAALSGHVGYRTSHALNTETLWAGGYHLAPSFDTLGILFHDLRDTQFLAHTIFDIPLAPAPRQLRIGYATEAFVHDSNPEVRTAYESAKQLLAKHGATLSPIDTAFWEEAQSIYAPIQASEASVIHRGFYQHFEPVITERLTAGAALTPEELATTRQRLADFRTQMAALFETHDLLIAPCAPIHQLRVNEDHTESRKAILRYTTPASLAGLPAITIPGKPHGTGTQLLAAANQDALLIAFASHLLPSTQN